MPYLAGETPELNDRVQHVGGQIGTVYTSTQTEHPFPEMRSSELISMTEPRLARLAPANTR
jgi:hypothetical protein